MENNSKYIFLTLEERNGEYEYTHRSVHQLSSNKTSVESFVKSHLKRFYGGEVEKEDNGYYFYGGEIFVQISSWRFISKKDFDILGQYL